MSTEPDLSRHRLLVTGASSGIGRAVALELGRKHGATIVGVARTQSALDELVTELGGPPNVAVALDVGDAAAWRGAAGALEGVTGAVLAAGVYGPVGTVGTWDPEQFADALRINVYGTLLAVHAVIGSVSSVRGSIVTFSGGGGTGPLVRFDAYAASKAAVVRLTENLGLDLADRGVRVNAIAPGFVATQMHRHTIEAGAERAGSDFVERTRKLLEGETGVSPRLAADLIAFLLSDDSRGITGKLLSAQWDPWQDPEFRARLAADPALATIRRIDEQFFTAKPPQ